MKELFNTDAETFLLAGLLRNPDAYWSINDVGLRSDDFMSSDNRSVFRAISAVTQDRKQPDLPLVIEELRGSDTGYEYVQRLSTVPCSLAQAKEFAATVKGLAVSRRLAQAGARIGEIAYERRADAEQALSDAESELRRVRDTMPTPERSPDPADILRRIRTAGPTRSIPLRFSPTLNEMTGGLQPGHIWIVGGFSSTGKSAFACNVIKDVLADRKWVGLVSTEMPQEKYLIRLLSLYSGVPQRSLRDRVMVPLDNIDALKRAESELARAKLRVFDTVYRLGDIRTQAKKMKETVGLDVFFVDFLGNVQGSTGDEVKDAREVVIELQLLAKELDITVVALSQVSNEMAKMQNSGEDGAYYSFKGSGAIRDAADVGLMLKRDRIKNSSLLQCQMVKNRDGEMRTIPLLMDLPTGRIQEDMDFEEDE